MRHSVPAQAIDGDVEQRVARLREALSLVEVMAGEPTSLPALEVEAAFALRLVDLPPVARRRLDALSAEATAFAKAGLAVLSRQNAEADLAPAAAALATDLRASLHEIERVARA